MSVSIIDTCIREIIFFSKFQNRHFIIQAVCLKGWLEWIIQGYLTLRTVPSLFLKSLKCKMEITFHSFTVIVHMVSVLTL